MKDTEQTPIMRLVIDITDSGRKMPKGKKPRKVEDPPEMDDDCEECGKSPCEC